VQRIVEAYNDYSERQAPEIRAAHTRKKR
jgi:hypothetical protein